MIKKDEFDNVIELLKVEITPQLERVFPIWNMT